MLDHPCVKLANSVGSASERQSEGRGFVSHMRLTLYLESKNFHNIEYHIYILGNSLSCAFVIVSELFYGEFPKTFVFLLKILLPVRSAVNSTLIYGKSESKDFKNTKFLGELSNN